MEGERDRAACSTAVSHTDRAFCLRGGLAAVRMGMRSRCRRSPPSSGRHLRSGALAIGPAAQGGGIWLCRPLKGRAVGHGDGEAQSLGQPAPLLVRPCGSLCVQSLLLGRVAPWGEALCGSSWPSLAALGGARRMLGICAQDATVLSVGGRRGRRGDTGTPPSLFFIFLPHALSLERLFCAAPQLSFRPRG